MPRAAGNIVECKKYAYKNQATSHATEIFPDQNTWYTGFEAEDVRHLICMIMQTNGEAAAQDIEVRWIVDGNDYLDAISLVDSTPKYVYRNLEPTGAGVLGLDVSDTEVNAGYMVDHRGQSYKTEIRITSVPGTNQQIMLFDVYETLEET